MYRNRRLTLTPHHRANGRRKAVLSTLVVALALLTGCAGLTTKPVDSDQASARFYAAGYRALMSHYIDEIALDRLTLSGLEELKAIDPDISVDASAMAIRISLPSGVSRQWSAPGSDDAEGWARLMSGAVAEARKGSARLGTEPIAELTDRVFRAALKPLDRYTRYADPARARRNQQTREGFGALGITVRFDDGETFIRAVNDDMPAKRAGMQVGDRITHVDGVPVSGMDPRDVIDRLRGRVGTTVVVRIAREGVEKPLEVTIVRERLIIPTVASEMDGDILILRMTGFNSGTAASAVAAVQDAETAGPNGIRGIILDLRGNPGGLLKQAVTVSDLFLDEGLVISTRGRHPGSFQAFDATRGHLADKIPMVVLVNGKSASAAEIVAIALRDRGRAVVLGSSSYGKGTVQTILGLPNGGELTMTWARMHAPSGFALQDHGIIPAICTSGGETAVTKTIELLRDNKPVPDALIFEQLRVRLQNATDPARARAACPPDDAQTDNDIRMSKLLLASPTLYARTRHEGKTAVASRAPGGV